MKEKHIYIYQFSLLPWKNKTDILHKQMTIFSSITLYESYNSPPYILAASAENKNKKSMVFILYKRRVLAKVSSSNFTSTGCLILEMAESE